LKRAEFISELALILGANENDLRPDARLDAFPSWDSMGKMAAITLIDSGVGLTVPFELLEQCETVGQLLAFVTPKLTEGAPAHPPSGETGASSARR
jgi:acyl carrier protein